MATPTQGGELLGRGCSSAAGAGTPSPPCMRCAVPGALLEPFREWATPPAVASQVAGRSGRAGLPRLPPLSGSQLHLLAIRWSARPGDSGPARSMEGTAYHGIYRLALQLIMRVG